MKILLGSLVLVSFLYADEMQRIESILQDITNLRSDYEKCQASLDSKKSIKVNKIWIICKNVTEELLEIAKTNNFYLSAKKDILTLQNMI